MGKVATIEAGRGRGPAGECESSGERLWQRIVAPAVSLVALAFVIYFAVDGFENLIGVAPDNPLASAVPTLAWLIPALYPAVGVLGVIWALILRTRRPDVYRSIGLGANSVTGLATQSRVLPTQHVPMHDATVGSNR